MGLESATLGYILGVNDERIQNESTNKSGKTNITIIDSRTPEMASNAGIKIRGGCLKNSDYEEIYKELNQELGAPRTNNHTKDFKFYNMDGITASNLERLDNICQASTINTINDGVTSHTNFGTEDVAICGVLSRQFVWNVPKDSDREAHMIKHNKEERLKGSKQEKGDLSFLQKDTVKRVANKMKKHCSDNLETRFMDFFDEPKPQLLPTDNNKNHSKTP